MEQIFLQILRRIADRLPQLSLVDEDYGQLETDADTYPVTFPCVLVGNVNTDWDDLGYGLQKGACTITVRLVVDCYDDTHLGSGSEHKITERLALAGDLYRALQGFVCDPNMGPLERIKSRDYTIAHNIKVYEQIYTFEYHDESALQKG